MTSSSPNRIGSIVGGLILLGVGVWFLLGALGVPLPGVGALWPLLVIFGGLAFIGMFLFGNEEPGILVPGVGGLLTGIFFLLITVGPLNWEDLGTLWPVFPLIGGMAFVVTYLADRSEPGLLVPGLGGLAVGMVGLLFTLGNLDFALIATWWPLLLIVIGVILLVQNVSKRGKSR